MTKEELRDWLQEKLDNAIQNGHLATTVEIPAAEIQEKIKELECEDDVCEWRKVIKRNFFYTITHRETSCNQRLNIDLDKWKYCPYCGKPIRTIEEEKENVG